MLKDNVNFRMLFIDVLEKKGESRNIYKDLARSIRKHHYCLISEPLQEMEKYYNPDALIRGITNTKLRVDFNKRDLNHAYYIAYLAQYVGERDVGIVLTENFDDISKWLSHHDVRSSNLLYCFMEAFYREKLGKSLAVKLVLGEYVRQCCLQNEKISLRIKSLDHMREFDEMDF